MNKCKFKTKNGRCGLKGCYAYKYNCYGLDMCKCWEPLTNADHIRAMNDEEMASWLEYEGGGACAEVCGWLDWLRQPWEGDED